MDCIFFRTQKIQRKKSIVRSDSTKRVQWILPRLKIIMNLELGCHGIIKLDGVSTHTCEDTTEVALHKGYHSRTTPPNTTTVLLECDQIFGLSKGVCRNNIDALVEDLQKRGGSGNLNGTHLPVMLCGRDARTDTYIDAGGIKSNRHFQASLPLLTHSQRI